MIKAPEPAWLRDALLPGASDNEVEIEPFADKLHRIPGADKRPE